MFTMNILQYNPKLKEKTRRLRNNCTKAEIRLWLYLKGRQMMGYDFHRQKPIDNFIVDFFCRELMPAIEPDGCMHTLEEVADRDERKEQGLKNTHPLIPSQEGKINDWTSSLRYCSGQASTTTLSIARELMVGRRR